MSKLKDLFKRKPGGTTVGNLLRSGSKMAANALAPGSGKLLGNGAMKISEQAFNDKSLRKAELVNQLTGAIETPLAAATIVSKDDKDLQFTTNGAQSQRNAIKEYIQDKDNRPKVILIAVALVGGVIFVVKRLRGGKRRR